MAQDVPAFMPRWSPPEGNRFRSRRPSDPITRQGGRNHPAPGELLARADEVIE